MELVSRPFAVPALLLALPLIAIGALALRGLDQDYQAVNQARTAAALSALRHVDTAIHARLTAALRAGWTLAERAAPQPSPTGFRELILSGKIAFATLYDRDRRLYPPDNNDAMLVSDVHRLQQLEPQISAVRTRPDQAERSGLSRLDGRPAPFICKLTDDGRDLCVVIAEEALADAVRQGSGEEADDQWSVTVIDPDAPPRMISSPLASLAASEPLRGWRLEARPAAPMAMISPRWLGMASIVLPLIAGWLTLAWYFYRTQRQELVQARKRGEMISLLSHELRTPIANLTLYADLLRRRADDRSAIIRYCDILEDEIGRLGALAESTLSFAKGENPARHTEIAVPDRVVEQIIVHFQPLLDRAGCTAIVMGRADRAVSFDRRAFEQCLIALLDNARKYAPGGPINITTAIVGGRLRLTVRDRGPGVPPAQRDRVFDPMTRGDHPDVEGFGLGLAAVRRLARAAGGDAVLTPADEGACFVVEITATMPPAEDSGPCAS